ncbi:uncharacterized protein LOC132745070, partial [Ruditapes philippinarum]|uniref:uncharacterized protein LOC132745070 n=1 Tax=Ruditapes philippinarum TaxID=129788 RepID=UPI00295AAFA9
SNSCGTLISEQENVLECQTARLKFTPNNVNAKRVWFKEDKRLIELLNSKNKRDGTKYHESRNGGTFILSISDVGLADNGSYIVQCEDTYYSNRSILIITSKFKTGVCNDKCGELSVNTLTTTEGDPVIFQITNSPIKDVTWQKKLGSIFKNLEGEKYQVTFDNKTTHSLSILETEYEDTGEYRVNCGSTVSNTVYLNIVYSKPSVPTFSNVEVQEYCKPQQCIVAIVNKLQTIECFVKGGSREMTLNLLKNNTKLTNTNQTHKKIYSISHYHIRYTFIPSQTDTDIRFTCTVKNTSHSVQSSTSVIMYVIVPPTKIEVNANEVIEEEQGEVQCIAINGRPPLKLDLSIDSKLETNTRTKTKTKPGKLYDTITSTTRPFTRVDNQKKILCCSNIGGKICGETKLNVLCK